MNNKFERRLNSGEKELAFHVYKQLIKEHEFSPIARDKDGKLCVNRRDFTIKLENGSIIEEYKDNGVIIKPSWSIYSRYISESKLSKKRFLDKAFDIVRRRKVKSKWMEGFLTKDKSLMPSRSFMDRLTVSLFPIRDLISISDRQQLEAI